MSLTKKISSLNIRINKYIKIPKTSMPFMLCPYKIERISVV